MTRPTIRRLGPADAAAHRALMLAAYAREPEAFTSSAAERAALPLAWWAARLGGAQASEQVWGAFVGGQLLGAVGLALETRERTAHRATVFGMVVAPAWRGQGLGAALLQALIEAARELPQLRQLQLTVSSGNAGAQRLYEAAGFRSWGEEPQAVALDDGRFVGKLHMSCPLPGPAWLFGWADSEIADVERVADGWRLRCPAAQVRSADGRRQGHLGPVLVWLGTEAALPDPSGLLGRLTDGRLLQPGAPARRTLPLPFEASGPLTLELQPARGEALSLALQGLRVGAPPQARFSESLAC